MTDINIFLNVAVPTPIHAHSLASLSGIPGELVESGATVWVQMMVASVPMGEKFPVEEWFNSIPGQNTNLATDMDTLFRFCTALREADASEFSKDGSAGLFVRLSQIGQKVSTLDAHFNVALDY